MWIIMSSICLSGMKMYEGGFYNNATPSGFYESVTSAVSFYNHVIPSGLGGYRVRRFFSTIISALRALRKRGIIN